MSKLLQGGPMQPFVGKSVEEVPKVEPPDNQGVEVIADMRIVDLRQLQLASSTTADDQSIAFVYRRVRIQKMNRRPTNSQFALDGRRTKSKSAPSTTGCRRSFAAAKI